MKESKIQVSDLITFLDQNYYSENNNGMKYYYLHEVKKAVSDFYPEDYRILGGKGTTESPYLLETLCNEKGKLNKIKVGDMVLLPKWHSNPELAKVMVGPRGELQAERVVNPASRIVAIQASEHCVAVCINGYKETNFGEKKGTQSVYNDHNPGFALFTNNEGSKQELKDSIEQLVQRLKIGGDLSVFSFGYKTLTIGEFHFEESYRVPQNPLYDRTFHRHNIKAIGDITINKNQIKVRIKKMPQIHELTMCNLFKTADHREFIKMANATARNQDMIDPVYLKKVFPL